MKMLDTSPTGKIGSTVVFTGRYGTVCRSVVIPRNPQTKRQMQVRGHLAEQTRRFRELTEEQRRAWNTAAAAYHSKPKRGQSGPLTGLHLFVRVNCKLAFFGLEPLDSPPPPPMFPELTPQRLVITNTAGVIAMKLLCPADPGNNTVLRASAPKSPGVGVCREFRIIGMCPAPVAGWADITGLYTAQYGQPAAGRKIFVRVSSMVSGFESLPREFFAQVPDSQPAPSTPPVVSSPKSKPRSARSTSTSTRRTARPRRG
jgi:hypothetical protein